ncbi:MAG: hypothetical protein J7M38_08895 [Armatimonadetes bacterium]|nr:hypothetical protein [Armatimonadota bacterium]
MSIVSLLFYGPFAVAAVAGLGAACSILLVKKAISGRWVNIWKLSCALHSLWIWAILWLFLDMVVLLLCAADLLGESFAAAVISAFLAGPVATAIFTKGTQFVHSYWKTVSGSLDKVLVNDTPQREAYNFEKSILKSGTSVQRRIALQKILQPKKSDTKLMNYPTRKDTDD